MNNIYIDTYNPIFQTLHEPYDRQQYRHSQKRYVTETVPTNGISTLSWWWGLRAPETLRAMPAVA
jgi:hypothetical protein